MLVWASCNKQEHTVQLQIQIWKRLQCRAITYSIKEWRTLLESTLAELPDHSWKLEVPRDRFFATLTITGTENDLRAARRLVEPVLRSVLGHRYRVMVSG